jgi:hypothetical protein
MHYAENSPIKTHLNVRPFNIFKALALTDADLRALRAVARKVAHLSSGVKIAGSAHAGRFNAVVSIGSLRTRFPEAAKTRCNRPSG